MADALSSAADQAEHLAREHMRDARSATDDGWREAAGRAALCRHKARLWRLAAEHLRQAEHPDDAAPEAAKEERS